MKDRPILFSAPMVRAILDGSKTQTRRVVKQDREGLLDCKPTPAWDAFWQCVACPYGQPGDRLWVRETWGYRGSRWSNQNPDQESIYIRYRADDPQPHLPREILAGRNQHDATIPRQREQRTDETDDEYRVYLAAYWNRWRPSIHMPRWASRILLEITGVRVERAQDISEADAQAEGIEYSERFEGYCVGMAEHYNSHDPRMSYGSLWESINGPGSWAANPWVWVIDFRRVEP